jgi:hypothetical protein
MSFLYPRTIQITRPIPGKGAAYFGKQPYQGTTRDAEEPTLFDLPASIQYSATGRAKGGELPSDPASLSTWKILLPRGQVERDGIAERDIVTDEIGKRYQVQAAYWSPMGYTLTATLLQA